MTKTDLFIELAKPNAKGVSRWVNVQEFKDRYVGLTFGNGASWARGNSVLAKLYKIEFDKSKSSGNRIDRIRLIGNQKIIASQSIRNDIKVEIRKRRCVVLDVSEMEVDHKNGRKMNVGGDPRVLNTKTQTLEDFQPLSKAANNAKRQHCKVCTRTNTRFDAKLIGYPISYYKGSKKHSGKSNGCIGCFWYDPIEFRKHLKKK